MSQLILKLHYSKDKNHYGEQKDAEKETVEFKEDKKQDTSLEETVEFDSESKEVKKEKKKKSK